MIKIVTNFKTLLLLARELAEAEKSKDKDRIEKAKIAHDNYRDLCLKADEMII